MKPCKRFNEITEAAARAAKAAEDSVSKVVAKVAKADVKEKRKKRKKPTNKRHRQTSKTTKKTKKVKVIPAPYRYTTQDLFSVTSEQYENMTHEERGEMLGNLLGAAEDAHKSNNLHQKSCVDEMVRRLSEYQADTPEGCYTGNDGKLYPWT